MLEKLMSFGFKYGAPSWQYDQVKAAGIDVRQWSFRNPHHHPVLRDMNGTDKEVAEYLEADPGFEGQWDRFLKEVLRLVNAGAKEIFVCCTGGKHRSVYLVERLGKELGVTVEHRDLHR